MKTKRNKAQNKISPASKPKNALKTPKGAIKKRLVSYELSKKIAGFLFVLPWIIGFLLFFSWPLIESLSFSFRDIKIHPRTGKLAGPFVGLKNYSMMLIRDPRFPPMLLESLKNMIDVILIPVFSLIIAVLLNQEFKGRTVYRAIYFLPVIVTSGVVFLAMSSVVGATSADSAQNSYMFQSTGIKEILTNAGVGTSIINWISGIVDKVFSVVMRSGVQILLFISGLQKIPKSNYEAAYVEGANAWACFWKITLPRVSPMIMVTIIYTIVDTFTQYGAESSGVVSGNQVMYEIYRVGFGKGQQYSYAAAMAWIYFAMVLVIIGIIYLLIGRKTSKIDE